MAADRNPAADGHAARCVETELQALLKKLAFGWLYPSEVQWDGMYGPTGCPLPAGGVKRFCHMLRRHLPDNFPACSVTPSGECAHVELEWECGAAWLILDIDLRTMRGFCCGEARKDGPEIEADVDLDRSDGWQKLVQAATCTGVYSA